MAFTIIGGIFDKLEELRENAPPQLSLVTWSRLEAMPYTPDLQPGLQAQLADPLWMLARQWQMSEFEGEDAGTPVDVRISGEQAPLGRVLLGPVDGNAARRAVDFAAQSLPLETLVEQEGGVRARDARAAAMSGLQFARTLEEEKQASLVPVFARAYPLEVGGEAERDEVDTQGAAWRILVRGRAIDGHALARALRPFVDASGKLSGLPAQPSLSAAQAEGVKKAAERWLRWYEDALSEGPSGSGTPEAWRPRRQEYALAASARLSDTSVNLIADEYASGELDWFSFRADTAPSLGEPQVAVKPVSVQPRPMLPSAVRFPGMPADRYWEFEDTSVSVGAIEAGPTDLGRMLLAEFALVYGNDWFIVPLPLPAGALFRTKRFVVRDTFGVETLVQPSKNTDGTPWTVFSLSSPSSLASQLNGVFFLPPALGTRLESDPLEEVALFRDEMANMVWGVERRTQGASGEPMDRYREAAQVIARQALETADSDMVTADLVYRLMTTVPENWIPFVAVPASPNQPAGSFEISLARRTLLRTLLDGRTVPVYPKGVLLRSDASKPVKDDVLHLEDEEVPREGIVVRRTYQYARTPDGRSFVWLGRSKSAGRGEGSSGLRFDALVKKQR